MTLSRAGAAATILAIAALAGCGRSESPKVDAATERAEATERARKDAFGTQVQAHEKAKAIGADVNKKAEGQQDAVDKMSK
jgi:ribose 1,5-bisphosphokinase PhnN